MKFSSILIFSLLIFSGCNKSTSANNSNSNNNNGGGGGNPPPVTYPFAKGADVGWLTQMESQGINFYDSTGANLDCMLILKNLGMNAIRLRVWVNPSNGWCNTTDVVTKAVRAKNLGMKVLIDFHYSDVWADPGHQTKPAVWASENFAALQTSVYNHTVSVLDSLKANGVTPAWVQVGNETDDGMLWPDGQASVNMSNFTLLVNSGYNAVKSVDTSIKVIVHISSGYNNSLFRWMFDGLTSNGAKFDIIGMSLYPSYSPGGTASWSSVNAQCLSNMNDMIIRYNKPVMIVEVGMPFSDPVTSQSFLANIINKTKSIAGGMGLGVFYWEPESYNNWQGYTLGAFDNSGKPTLALSAFH